MAGQDKIVAIGPRQEIMSLRTVGGEPIPAEGPADALPALREQARDENVRLILLSETVAEGLREEAQELRSDTGTLILLVPSHYGTRGTTLQWMKRAMVRSIGVDVISQQ